MLVEVNLALSNRCNAKCIWCPTTRGTKHNFDMPKETAFKILDELENWPNHIGIVHFGENGEALYNPDFIEILRYARKKLPKTKINMLSNFGMMTKELAEVILKERLIDEFQVNIDGHDAESYYAVKKISYKSVLKNVIRYLQIRKVWHPEQWFVVNVVPAFEYTAAVKMLMQDSPDQVPDATVPFSNLAAVEQSWKKILEKYNVVIRHQSPGMWAERKTFLRNRDRIKIDQSKIDCPMFHRVESEAFIAPNGDWYPCCLDDNNDIVLGNVNTQSLKEIYDSQKRHEFVEKLRNRQYEEIGYPCNTVACCHHNHIPEYVFDDLGKDLRPGDMINFGDKQ